MEFNLKRDLCFFDLEATGLNVITDRIVQIGMIKYKSGGVDIEEFQTLVNPGIPISKEAIDIHGITPADVANKPTFIQVAEKVIEFIGDSDIAGYNSNRFDIPMLQEELYRAGYDLDLENRNVIDVQKIFYKMEPRTLSAAYAFYCGEELESAHDAMADVRATAAVLKGQIQKYENVDYHDKDDNVVKTPIVNDMKKLHEFTFEHDYIDGTRRLKINQKGLIEFNFGKYRGQLVGETCYKDRNYYNWIQEKDFTRQVKKTVQKELENFLKRHDIR